VTGPQVAGGKVDSATPFTPNRNFNLVLIKAAILTASGTNGVRLSLNRDNSGAPGTAIKIWNLVNLPSFPGCCKLDLARLKTTVRVNKGVQYWLVATTSKTTQDSSDSWNMNSRNIFGTVGQRFNNGSWQVTKNSALLPAFSVLGTPPTDADGTARCPRFASVFFGCPVSTNPLQFVAEAQEADALSAQGLADEPALSPSIHLALAVHLEHLLISA
jgi:hypothetical protein